MLHHHALRYKAVRAEEAHCLRRASSGSHRQHCVGRWEVLHVLRVLLWVGRPVLLRVLMVHWQDQMLRLRLHCGVMLLLK